MCGKKPFHLLNFILESSKFWVYNLIGIPLLYEG